MKRAGHVAAAAALVVLSLAPSAGAVDLGLTSTNDPGLVALGVGAFDFLHNNTATEFRGEYRFAHGISVLKPLVGLFTTTDGAVYAYGGFRADLIFGQHFVLMPVAAVGYFDRGSGKALGSPVEFKTGAEIAYRFDNASRLGIAFDHISNAGLTHRNPGEENLMLVWSLPIAGGP